ncbi:signal recognition particle receptor subunit alpha, partial [Citrobacter portucalensis]
MAKEKKRGFFSWLGFGQKEQAPENETEVKNEEQQPVAEETTVVDEQPHVEETRSEAETQAFAAEVVEVTEQVAEIEKLQPEEEPVAEQAQPEIEPVAESVAETVVETPAAVVIEREELPLPEEVKTEEVTAEEWQAEAETVEIVEAAEEEAENEPQLTDEELEAQALAAEAAEEAVMVVPVEEPAVEEPVEEEVVQEQEKPTKEGFFARLKRSLLKTKENLGSGFISLFRGKKIDDDLFEELEEQLLIADVGVETTRKIIANLTEGASRKQLKDAEALYGLLKEEMGEILAKVDEPLNVDGKTPFVILMVGVNGVGKTTTI